MAFKLILSVLLMTAYSAQGQLSCTQLSSGATDYYSCLGNFQFTDCDDQASPPDTIALTTFTCSNGDASPNGAGDYGGNAANKWCYPGVTSKGSVCGPAPPTCNAKGAFSAPANQCKSYYICVATGEGSYSQRMLTCPSGTNFSSAVGGCIAGPCVIGASPTTTTVATTTPECSPLRTYEDPTNCRRYYKCGLFGRRENRLCFFNKFYDTVSRTCQFNVDCGKRPKNV